MYEVPEVTHPTAVSDWPEKYFGIIGSDTLREIFRDLLVFTFRKSRPTKVSIRMVDELTYEFSASVPLQFQQGTDLHGDESILMIEIAYNTPIDRLIFLKLNALSDMMSIRFLLRGVGYDMMLTRGRRMGLKKVDVDDFSLRFRLERQVFGQCDFEVYAILILLERLSFCYPACEFTFSDLRQGNAWRFHQPEGIEALFRHRLLSYIPFHEPVVIHDVSGEIEMVIVFAFHTSIDTDIEAYVNGYRTIDGQGTHISGFVAGLVNAFNEVDQEEELGYDADKICCGLSAIISLTLPDEYVFWADSSVYLSEQPNMNFANKRIGKRIEMLTRERVIHELGNNRRFGQLIREGRYRHKLE